MSAGLPNRESIASEPVQKLCAACGENFTCVAAAGACWCEDVKLTSETRAALRTEYSDCLCPTCLAKVQIK
jgi:hypothetical protein